MVQLRMYIEGAAIFTRCVVTYVLIVVVNIERYMLFGARKSYFVIV